MISVLGDKIPDQILDHIRQAKWFTMIADEVTDASHKEQLSLALRYVNASDNLVCEGRIHFMECDTSVCGFPGGKDLELHACKNVVLT